MSSTLNPYFYAYNPQLLAYENAWVEYIRNDTRPLDNVIGESIWQSWKRCREAGLHPLKRHENDVLNQNDLERRRMEHEQILKIAVHYMKPALEAAPEGGVRIEFLDANGYLLESMCSEGLRESSEKAGMVPGSNWREGIAGTSAVSLVLTTHQAWQVTGAEHYLQQFHRWSCSAAPIQDQNGELLGIINVCNVVEKFHRLSLSMIISIARAIENELQTQNANDELKRSSEQIRTLLSMSTDGIVYYEEGIVRQVNQEICKLLDKREEELIGHPVEVIETTPSLERIERYMGDSSNTRELVLKGRKHSYKCLYDLRRIDREEISGMLLLVTRIDEIKDMVRRITNTADATFADIVYVSNRMAEQIEIAKRAASFDSRILIEGESGTGKDLMAQSIHNYGTRRDNAFVAINCGAIPQELFESELFGYERGAFTGAKNEGKIGLLELADKGTVFLDEVDTMPMAMQAKLLRVLQENALTKIGGTEKIPVDIRVIAATNADLDENVKQGTFREDLYYRLNVINIHIPPLRERREDIPVLVEHFMQRDEGGRYHLEFSREVSDALTQYEWPGNVRQLQNVIERFLIMNDHGKIYMDALPSGMRRRDSDAENVFSRMTTLEDIQTEYINYVLKSCKGNVSRAAGILGLSRATIYKYKRD